MTEAMGTMVREATPPLPIFDRQKGIVYRFQERDLEILVGLNRYRYLRTGQIKRLVFPDCKSIQSCRRRLKYLFHDGLIGRIQPFVQIGKGQPDTAYYLEKKGAEALQREMPDEEIRWFRKSGQIKRLFLDHALDVSEFRLNLELSLRDHPVVELVRFVADFEMKEHIGRAVGKHRYKLYTEVTHPSNRQNYVVYPDGMFILRGKGDYAKFQRLYFVEIDRGTMSMDRIRDKVIGYHLYHQLGITRETRCQSYKKYGKFEKFRVLLVTASEKRVMNIRRALVGLSGEELVWVGQKANYQNHLDDFMWFDSRMKEKKILK